jgi:Secretion system C-terminal sorting domain
LGGNQVNTGMQYAQPGIYNVCLRITTARGCVDSVCNMVVVPRDSINGVVRIITVSPNPATTQVTALIWSAVANVPADIAIYDVYGIRKLGVSRNLTQGNNTQSIPVSQLLRGPYILRVTTSYGVQSRTFFKL